MNPENDGQVLRINRRVNIKDLTFERRFGIGNVTLQDEFCALHLGYR